MLDVLTPGELMAAAQRGDKAAVSRANGVGPKLALRIVTELKDKPIAADNVVAFHAGAAAPPRRIAVRRGGRRPDRPRRRRSPQPAAPSITPPRASAMTPLEAALIKAALQELGRERA